MAYRVDISGMKFGMLTVIKFSHSVNRKSLWLCECDCGIRKPVYMQSLKNGDCVSCGCFRAKAKDPVERIKESSTIAQATGCWEWSLRKDRGGYGRLKVQLGSREAYRFEGAHRYAYTVFKGGIPDGMEVCHSCDNPSCVNPDHLWLGTHQQNMADMHAKGRGPKGYTRKRQSIDSAIREEDHAN